ncbi:MAG TPA: CPBP family intramembrane glutamic endopeptidase, partial [Bryobacteraceae bacterium]
SITTPRPHAFWHLPQFFVLESDTNGQSFPLFTLQVVAFSVALAWLWDRTGGSLLLPMLLHSAYNNSKDIVPSAVQGASNPFAMHSSAVGWLTAMGLWIVAGCLMGQMPKAPDLKGDQPARPICTREADDISLMPALGFHEDVFSIADVFRIGRLIAVLNRQGLLDRKLFSAGVHL